MGKSAENRWSTGFVFLLVAAVFSELVLIVVDPGQSNISKVKAASTLSSIAIYVPDDYPTIQQAVDNASAGDTIIVRDGIYYENVVVDKQLTIESERGPASTTIKGVGSQVVKIISDNVKVEGFTITSGVYGLYIFNSSNNNISSNIISNNENGIFLKYSSNNVITYNTVTSNHKNNILLYSSDNNIITRNNITTGISNVEHGVSLYSSSYNAITYNSISNNSVGIWSNSTSYNNIISNNLIVNHANGIDLDSSGYNTISNNTLINNSNGMYLSSSCNNIITNNIIIQNTTSASRLGGLQLWKFSNHNIIISNTISNYTYGVYIWKSCDNILTLNNIFSNSETGINLDSLSNNNIITYNTISKSKIGIKVFFSSNTIVSNTIASNYQYGIHLYLAYNNIIFSNLFINNTNQAYSDSRNNRWNASYPKGGNYWSDYSGIDIYSGPNQNISGSDGIGDVPYNIGGGSGGGDHYPLISTTPPEIKITSPIVGAILATSHVTVSWTGPDEIDHYEIMIDLGSWINVGVKTSHKFTDLSDGAHTVYVKAVDKSGNVRVAGVMFIVDLLSPQITITSPSNGSILNMSNVTISWRGNDSGSGINRYELRVDVLSWIDVGTNMNYTLENMKEGEHTVTVRAYDFLNRTSGSTVNFTLDLTPPVVTVQPFWGVIYPGETLTINFSALDNIGVGEVVLQVKYLNGTVKNYTYTENFTNLSFTFPVFNTTGMHIIQIFAWDLAGNMNSSSGMGVKVSRDGEEDGMDDKWEREHGLDPARDDSSEDPDGDGLTNLQEFLNGTDPGRRDSDDDSLGDGEEVELGTNPLSSDTDWDGLNDGEEVSLGSDPLRADTDWDGLSDGVEVELGTDLLRADSDGDGYKDGEEVVGGYDPLDPNSYPGSGGNGKGNPPSYPIYIVILLIMFVLFFAGYLLRRLKGEEMEE